MLYITQKIEHIFWLQIGDFRHIFNNKNPSDMENLSKVFILIVNHIDIELLVWVHVPSRIFLQLSFLAAFSDNFKGYPTYLITTTMMGHLLLNHDGTSSNTLAYCECPYVMIGDFMGFRGICSSRIFGINGTVLLHSRAFSKDIRHILSPNSICILIILFPKLTW